nr:MAG TPA: hypothetical protein [Caudoviricetes sp.]
MTSIRISLEFSLAKNFNFPLVLVKKVKFGKILLSS